MLNKEQIERLLIDQFNIMNHDEHPKDGSTIVALVKAPDGSTMISFGSWDSDDKPDVKIGGVAIAGFEIIAWKEIDPWKLTSSLFKLRELIRDLANLAYESESTP